MRCQLDAVVDARFAEAAERQDAASVSRFARLFRPLGRRAEGLTRFTEYIRAQVWRQASADLNAVLDLVDTGKKARYSATGCTARLRLPWPAYSTCLACAASSSSCHS